MDKNNKKSDFGLSKLYTACGTFFKVQDKPQTLGTDDWPLIDSYRTVSESDPGLDQIESWLAPIRKLDWRC